MMGGGSDEYEGDEDEKKQEDPHDSDGDVCETERLLYGKDRRLETSDREVTDVSLYRFVTCL